MSIIQLMPSSPLESGPFREAQVRLEKVFRIAADLKEGGSRRRQRREELEAVEASSTQQPDLSSVPTMKEEIFIVACGWNEARVRMRYVSRDLETLMEDLVLFYRGASGGGLEWLLVKGAVPLIPASLYDASLISRKHAVPAPHRKCKIRMIPRIDGRGAYLGVFSVMVDMP